MCSSPMYYNAVLYIVLLHLYHVNVVAVWWWWWWRLLVTYSKPASCCWIVQRLRWRQMRSADKLLLAVPRTSAKAFGISAPSFWNSLSYNCKSADFSALLRRVIQKPNCLTCLGLYSKHEHLAQSLPLCASDSFATYGAIQMCSDWLIDSLTELRGGQRILPYFARNSEMFP